MKVINLFSRGIQSKNTLERRVLGLGAKNLSPNWGDYWLTKFLLKISKKTGGWSNQPAPELFEDSALSIMRR
jgi:hypothetical protein